MVGGEPGRVNRYLWGWMTDKFLSRECMMKDTLQRDIGGVVWENKENKAPSIPGT